MTTAPFDRSLPSPLQRLAQLRYRSAEAVVRDGKSTDVQLLMAPRGQLEQALFDQLGSQSPPKLIVLTGSAGSGKSAAVNHLLQMVSEDGRPLIHEYLADATHADSPDQKQAERLAEFFAPFRDGAHETPEPCRVIAMNTGMAVSFFYAAKALSPPPRLTGLEALLRQRLGLPSSEGSPAEWLKTAVLVVNLDHRPTAGLPGDLFDELLRRLDPGRTDGVFQGAARCVTCTVSDWCWPMANAVALSGQNGREAVNAAAGEVALARGRQIAPRALWDAAAELAIAGLDLNCEDPCDAVAEVAERGDENRLVQGLACNTALAEPSPGSLLAELSLHDPGFSPSQQAHELISDQGLDPASDADRFQAWLSPEGTHPAVARGAAYLKRGGPADDGSRSHGRVLARAAWLGGELITRSHLPAEFASALAAQGTGMDPDDDPLYVALLSIENGVAAAFGLTSGPEKYYPTTTPAPGAAAELLVEAKLEDYLKAARDPVLLGNPAGAALVGYRPLVLSIEAAGRPLQVDYPLWQLLDQASKGAPPSAVDLERFLALRQAVRSVGVSEAAKPLRALLIRERGPDGRKFRIISRNPAGTILRATEVI